MKTSVLPLCALGCLVAPFLLSLPAEAKTDAPPPPERKSKQATQKRSHPAEVPSNLWSDAEIAAAKAKCTETLSGIGLDFEPLPPIKQGLCGTPAPILLRSLGRDAEVEIDPPATVSCELAKALSDWVDDLQRDAEALLGSTVVKLRASSYVCRNVYDGADPPLSQHALANALDLSEFVLASGEHIAVREDWHQRSADAELPLRNPIHLTNASGSLQTVVASLQGKSVFLQSAHENACRIFGTVLGPRANRAHHDHFHLDIKERRASLCR
jgi:hypothetical protein